MWIRNDMYNDLVDISRISFTDTEPVLGDDEITLMFYNISSAINHNEKEPIYRCATFATYETEEMRQKEFSAICMALQNGDNLYSLQFYAI